MPISKQFALKWLRNGLVIVLLGAAVTFFAVPKEERYLSNESAFALKDLNTQYAMVVTEDLLNESNNSTLLADLLHADIMQAPEEVDNPGIIMSMKDESDGMLLIQPKRQLSDNQLQEVADEYGKLIDEAHFEVDQDLEIAGRGWETFAGNLGTLLTGAEEADEYVTVKVAVIDSGLQFDHEQFEGVNVEVSQGANLIDESSSVTDEIGHGTHVAGIIAENAPGITIKPYKIVDLNGGRLSSVIKAVDLATQDEVDVINMSLGVMDNSYALKNVVSQAKEEGVIVVAAAGNFGSDTGFYPASYDEALAVGGVYSSGRKMRSSNYGDWVDLTAPGYRVHSSIPYDRYGYKDGTSQSAAVVSAEIANLLKENPNRTEEDILEILNTGDTVNTGDFRGLPFVE
jgi:hypothetical protein